MNKIISWCNAGLSMLMAALGFSSCGSNSPFGGAECLYGCPTATFDVKGTIVNEKNEAVNAVSVSLKEKHNDAYVLVSQSNTDERGQYGCGTITQSAEATFRIVVEDPEGRYEADSTEVTMKSIGGDGKWNMGRAEEVKDFKLKKVK